MRDPPGMSDARWTCNPLPGDADSPARVTRPARPRHRAARADGPGALEMGDRAAVPGQLPPSRPLWARPVGSELRARYKPRTQQMAQPSSPGASHHASLGPLISPRPSWPPQDPPQLLGEPSGQGTLFPTAPTPPTRWPGCRERQASPGRRAPGPAWSPAGGHGPQEQEPDKGQQVSWDGKTCSSKAVALLAGGPRYFWIPSALAFPGTPSPIPPRF